MGEKVGKQMRLEIDVYEAAITRIHSLYDRFDTVAVSFSGGKDSTACLQLVLEVARERNRLPVSAFFVDEEVIPDPTIDYVRRVSQMDEVNLKWYCLPIRHRNACSRIEPWWYCWDPDRRDVWVRELPPEAITEHPNFRLGMTLPELGDVLQLDEPGQSVQVQGIRAMESMRRRIAVSQRAEDNHITGRVPYQKGYPIYDWSQYDVWIAPQRFGWDYNTTYDVYEAAGLTLHQQRVCPPFGEQPLQTIHIYQQTFPEMWEKMIHRVHGAATAGRYGRTELYSGLTDPPPGMTYQEFFPMLLASYSLAEGTQIVAQIQQLVELHCKKSRLDIQDSQTDPISGASWRFFCTVVNRGDLKGRVGQSMTLESDKELARQKISFDEAVRRWGTPEYQRKHFSR